MTMGETDTKNGEVYLELHADLDFSEDDDENKNNSSQTQKNTVEPSQSIPEPPKQECNKFPRCPYGSSCLYSHPPCKYGTNCLNRNCIYFHDNYQRPNTTGKQSIPCKFGKYCMNPSCKFSHRREELCRFGTNCLLETCLYTHPPDRKKPPNAFRWSAQS